MADRPGGEPTEAPSPKRLEKARKEGQVAYSSKVSAITTTTVLLFLGSLTLTSTVARLKSLTVLLLSGSVPHTHALRFALHGLLSLALPVGVALFFALLVAGFLQVGFRFNPYPLLPKLSRISPAQGFKRIFSKARFVELLFAVLALVASGTLFSLYVKRNLGRILQTGRGGVGDAALLFTELALGFVVQLLLLFLLFAALDWALVFLRHRKQLMMTTYEVKKEMKQEEGDPLLKGQRRAIHLELSRMGVERTVPQSEAVVVNPTHLAVALMRTPNQGVVVSAKGSLARAQQIRALATAHGIPLYYDKSLAHRLHALKVGEPIPHELLSHVQIVLDHLTLYGG